MIIYEVNISSAKSIDELSYLAWLKVHIEELEALPGFLTGTQVYLVDGAGFSVSVHYKLESMDAMKRYLQEFAVEMRSKLPVEFIGQLNMSRRILTDISLEARKLDPHT